jgi:hypothetical protein
MFYSKVVGVIWIGLEDLLILFGIWSIFLGIIRGVGCSKMGV